MRSKTVSQKKTERHTERCDSCGLWFLYLHPGTDGRYLCSVCVRLEPGNRSSGRTVQVAAGRAGRR
jgi:hypothetical protein